MDLTSSSAILHDGGFLGDLALRVCVCKCEHNGCLVGGGGGGIRSLSVLHMSVVHTVVCDVLCTQFVLHFCRKVD